MARLTNEEKIEIYERRLKRELLKSLAYFYIFQNLNKYHLIILFLYQLYLKVTDSDWYPLLVLRGRVALN